MSPLDKMNTLLYSTVKDLLFCANLKDGVSYTMDNSNENIDLYDKKILEYDVDINEQGHMGVIILDCDGKLQYMYYDGNLWATHLLYAVDFDVEEFKYITIKFSHHTPQIIFCWRNLSAPNYWSVISYSMKDGDWSKDVIGRIHTYEGIKPYIFIRDHDYNLSLIYLKNNNMIYDIMITSMSAGKIEWNNASYLASCIYLKSFHIDAIFDREGLLHIAWSDKNKQHYLTKYISTDFINISPSNSISIVQTDRPLDFHHLFCDKNRIICYGIMDTAIYYSIKMKQFTQWTDMQRLNITDPISIFRMVQSPNNPSIQYEANYILTSDLSSYAPITVNVPTKSTKLETENEKEAIIKTSIQTIDSKESNPHLQKKNLDLKGKNNIIHTLQGELAYLKEEVKRLSTQNMEYIKIIRGNNEKYKKNIQKVENLQASYDKALKDLKSHEIIYTESIKKIELLNKSLKDKEIIIEDLTEENEVLKKELSTLENSGLFRRIFR